MNKRIKGLVDQCWEEDGVGPAYINPEKFAKLIVEDTINLLKQEWYDRNNEPKVENESPRDVGLRVGAKSQTIRLMHMIMKHYGYEND